jgi:hypothetical protein
VLVGLGVLLLLLTTMQRGATGTVRSSSSALAVPCSAAASATIAANFAAKVDGDFSAIDIYEHLPLIYTLARRAPRTTEIGVRSGISSWAFAAAAADRAALGLPASYRASDVKRLAGVDQLDMALLGCPGIDYKYILGNDLELLPWESDLLFIDTWHVYKQLAAELPRWAPFTSSTILLHDTSLNGERDESPLENVPKNDALFVQSEKSGLWQAVTDFLASPAGAKWRLKERRENNNGLTVLVRVKPEKRE